MSGDGMLGFRAVVAGLAVAGVVMAAHLAALTVTPLSPIAPLLRALGQ